MHHGDGGDAAAAAGCGGVMEADVVVDDGVDGGGDDGPTTVDTHSWPLYCWAQGHPAETASSSSCPGRESIRVAFLGLGKQKSKLVAIRKEADGARIGGFGVLLSSV